MTSSDILRVSYVTNIIQSIIYFKSLYFLSSPFVFLHIAVDHTKEKDEKKKKVSMSARKTMHLNYIAEQMLEFESPGKQRASANLGNQIANRYEHSSSSSNGSINLLPYKKKEVSITPVFNTPQKTIEDNTPPYMKLQKSATIRATTQKTLQSFSSIVADKLKVIKQ
jgi:hypothetical protein